MPEKTTTHFALPYPTSAGEVKVGATDFEELAVKLDSVIFEGNKVASGTSYSAQSARAEKTPFTASATRAAQVVLEAYNTSESGELCMAVVFCGGKRVTAFSLPFAKAAVPGYAAFSFICPAGSTWEWEKVAGLKVPSSFESTYLLL